MEESSRRRIISTLILRLLGKWCIDFDDDVIEFKLIENGNVVLEGGRRRKTHTSCVRAKMAKARMTRL